MRAIQGRDGILEQLDVAHMFDARRSDRLALHGSAPSIFKNVEPLFKASQGYIFGHPAGIKGD
jgi:hypothetical protein